MIKLAKRFILRKESPRFNISTEPKFRLQKKIMIHSQLTPPNIHCISFPVLVAAFVVS